MNVKNTRKANRIALLAAFTLLVGAATIAAINLRAGAADGDQADNAQADDAKAEQARMEFKARDMLNKGLDLLEAKQEERGLKLINSVPTMFPKAKTRFKAYAAAGNYHLEKNQYELALKQFSHLDESDDPNEQAEGLFKSGVCYFNLNRYDKVFVVMRKITREYESSEYTNQAYYYIGQCHCKQGRWAKAIEALEMVGTSVPAAGSGNAVAEAGQRLYISVEDADLGVLLGEDGVCSAKLTTARGDTETIKIRQFGQSRDQFVGSIATVPGEPAPGDNILEIAGGDKVTVEYIDQNTQAGEVNVKRASTIEIVSTASVGFTDGAYREHTRGIFGNAPCFIRVKDIDRDITAGRDQIRVRVVSDYKAKKQDDEQEQQGINLEEEPDRKIRDVVEVVLVESQEHSGIFLGTLTPTIVSNGENPSQSDQQLSVKAGDDVYIEYTDEKHILSGEPRDLQYRAKLLVGQIQDVKIEHRVVDSLDVKARKNLIEGKIYLRLAEVFKEVGLTEKAYQKADEGLSRVEEVISMSTDSSLDRALVEEALSVKWNLLLTQDKLGEAFDVCNTLIRLFPDSALVDRALLKMGLAKMESDNPREAIGLFTAVTKLPKSDLKAEAQYNIGQALELEAIEVAKQTKKPPVLGPAIMAYKSCAELYPESTFAGDALGKIADYYVNSKDFDRAIELMEKVFQDYPDATFLDNMLLKWVVAAYQKGDYRLAKEKAEQLLSEYPDSKQAEKVKSFLEIIDKKLK